MRDPAERVSLADEIALGRQYFELEQLRLARLGTDDVGPAEHLQQRQHAAEHHVRPAGQIIRVPCEVQPERPQTAGEYPLGLGVLPAYAGHHRTSSLRTHDVTGVRAWATVDIGVRQGGAFSLATSVT